MLGKNGADDNARDEACNCSGGGWGGRRTTLLSGDGALDVTLFRTVLSIFGIMSSSGIPTWPERQSRRPFWVSNRARECTNFPPHTRPGAAPLNFKLPICAFSPLFCSFFLQIRGVPTLTKVDETTTLLIFYSNAVVALRLFFRPGPPVPHLGGKGGGCAIHDGEKRGDQRWTMAKRRKHVSGGKNKKKIFLCFLYKVRFPKKILKILLILLLVRCRDIILSYLTIP
jgi:hypothetical protein